MHRSTRAAGVLLAFATLLALSGCAGSLRENYLRDQAAAHVYRKPVAEVWVQVQQVLREQGYSLRDNPGHFVLETEWKESGGGTLGVDSSSRYLVRGITLPNGDTVLRVMRGDRVVQSTGMGYVSGIARTDEERAVAASNNNTRGTLPARKSYDRDLEMELLLLQRIDPDAAARLDAAARAAHP